MVDSEVSTVVMDRCPSCVLFQIQDHTAQAPKLEAALVGGYDVADGS